MSRLGAFLAGGIGGYATAKDRALRQSQDRRAEELHGVRMEESKLGLEQGRARAEDLNRERQYKLGRQKLIDDLMADPTMVADSDSGQGEGARGPRTLGIRELSKLHEDLGLYDFRHGRIDQNTFVDMPRRIRMAQDEGMLEAYRYFVETGDPAGAAERFNATGRTRVDPTSLRVDEKRDPITGATYQVIRHLTEDGKEGIFDPLQMAAFAGGSKGYLDWTDQRARRASEARRASAAEVQAEAADRRAGAQERRADVAERRAESQGRRDDAMVDIARRREDRPPRQSGGKLTLPQLNRNLEIAAARKRITGMSADEIRSKTAKTTNTGRDNPDYDPLLERAARLAFTRKYGDDEDFDGGRWGSGKDAAPEREPRGASGGWGSIDERFKSDASMKGRRLGQQTPRGREVLDASGKLIGFYN